MTLAELNACDRDRFVNAVGWVFEHSPWVASRTWDLKPFASLDHLHAVMTAAVDSATADEQLALLRAHPDLGARTVMSGASVGEQRGAGLDSLTQDDLDRLQRLNLEYRAKFGFPFLLAVKGSTIEQILGALERRAAAAPEDELAEALRQVARIARFRLEEIVSP
jgi:2-oxo-4-hydroxy-4-carboxy-5-ureidoimidazoline decarboxylase